MKIVYIASPGKANNFEQAKRHVLWAQAMWRKAIEEGLAPISTILMGAGRDPSVLVGEGKKDPAFRRRALRYGLDMVDVCDEMLVFVPDGCKYSAGVTAELDRANVVGKTIRYWHEVAVNQWAEEFGLVKK